MTTRVKICGITTQDALDAAVTHGASYVGFVYCPASPRHITPEAASALRARLPAHVQAVSVVVDASGDVLERIVSQVMPDILQLHGRETPARVRDIREKFGIPVMKAIGVATPADLLTMADHAHADLLLFDAKPPKDATLAGGNAVCFDWKVLHGVAIPKPWMLSGGLTPANVADAIRATGAAIVDVSSGVESAAGVKDVQKIAAFIQAAQC